MSASHLRATGRRFSEAEVWCIRVTVTCSAWMETAACTRWHTREHKVLYGVTRAMMVEAGMMRRRSDLLPGHPSDVHTLDQVVQNNRADVNVNSSRMSQQSLLRTWSKFAENPENLSTLF
eukprot:1963808-Amphidinium_carterae.1